MRETIKYKEFVRAGTMVDTEQKTLLLAGLGLAGETAEVAELTEQALHAHLATTGLATRGGIFADRIKKLALHNRPLDRDKVVEELGDVLWYFQLACLTFDIPVEEIARENVKKLVLRYPEVYGPLQNWT